MIIKVGTNNAIKIEAVKEALVDYPLLAEAEVLGVNVSSEVSEQPLSRYETLCGARNRAAGAYKDGAYFGVGIESGISETYLGYINFTTAIIYDGERYHIGQSTGFPVPPKMIVKIIEEGMDMDQAAYACGFVDVPNIGKVDGGFLGVLTKGRISRKTYSKQALVMALISWENKEMFAVPNENRS